MSKRHGNDRFWCFIEDDVTKEVAVWMRLDASREYGSSDNDIMCRCPNQYYAMEIVDALINKSNTEKDRGITKFGPKELAFMDFIKNHCPEPYSTMADLAVTWNDWDRYKQLRDTFPSIYS